ncbi:alpha/beta hydrolase [bacterium]|nr:alpha/beta hydrolase [bacterium]
MKRFSWLVFFIFLLGGAWSQTSAYDYPLKDPYLATVIGTPSKFQPKLPEKIDYKMLSFKVFPERVVPSVFWYQRDFRYSLTYQKGEAPLIFVIAGTGSTFYSSNMIFFQRIFYQAGFHVICLPSPTSMNFITTASATSLPGNIIADAVDLYRVMTMAWEQVKDRIKVSEFYLTGYSLGASEAAFVAKLDEEKRVFNFKKVLMINPAVSLYSSAKILDQMILRALPGGLKDFNDWLNGVLGKFSEFYKEMGYIDLSHDWLYDIYKTKYKTQSPKQENLATMIGFAFRISSNNMIFTSDVMTNAGLIVPKNLTLGSADSLYEYFRATSTITFVDYFDELLFPYYKAKYPELTQEMAIQIVSLHNIQAYLEKSPKIGLMGNEDDLILTPQDLNFLKYVFGSRAKIYPYGGHCGNMSYTENVEYMLNFFKR